MLLQHALDQHGGVVAPRSRHGEGLHQRGQQLAADAVEFRDDLHRAYFGRAGDRTAGERGEQEIHRVESGAQGSIDELLARVRALLRRVAPAGADDCAPVEAEGVRIDEAARRAWRGTRELELTKTEFELLALLVRNAGIVLSHTTIYEDIWGYDFGPDSKALAVYIGYLRRKTEQDGEPRIVQTVRGVGYTLRAS